MKTFIVIQVIYEVDIRGNDIIVRIVEADNEKEAVGKFVLDETIIHLYPRKLRSNIICYDLNVLKKL